MADIDDEKIRDLAYQLWQRDGSPHGKDEDYWHAARELLADEGETAAAPDSLLQVPIVPLAAKLTK